MRQKKSQINVVYAEKKIGGGCGFDIVRGCGHDDPVIRSTGSAEKAFI